MRGIYSVFLIYVSFSEQWVFYLQQSASLSIHLFVFFTPFSFQGHRRAGVYI